jgi:hypothetical protein
MVMPKGKHAFFFTFLAILVIILLYIIVQTESLVENRDERLLVQERIDSISGLLTELEEEMLPDILTSVSQRSLYIMANHTNATQSFWASKDAFEASFRELAYNGTLSGTPQDALENQTILALLDMFSEAVQDAYHITFNISIDNESIRIIQQTPYSVGVFANLTFSAQDKEATWLAKQETVFGNFSIIGFMDPYYAVWTKGNYTQYINKTNTSWDNDWDVFRLNKTIQRHLYASSTIAPSFLQRFYNDTNASSAGIESFIDADTLKDHIAEDYINFSTAHNRSYVDHLFFRVPWECWDYIDVNNTQAYDLHSIQGIDITGFRLEDEHLYTYLNSTETQDVSLGGLTKTVCSND